MLRKWKRGRFVQPFSSESFPFLVHVCLLLPLIGMQTSEMTAGSRARARTCLQTRTKKSSRRRDGGLGRSSVRNCHLERTVSSQSLRRLRQSEHRLSLSVSIPSRPTIALLPRQSRQHFGSAMLSRAPQLPESHYQNCQSARNAAFGGDAIDAQVDRRRNGERGRNSECETTAVQRRGHRLQPAR